MPPTEPDYWTDSRLLIDGKLVESSTGRTFANVNPATGLVFGAAADASVADMDAAIGAARRAFDEGPWAADVGFRQRCLTQLHDAFLRHADELRPVLVAEVGCPVASTIGPQQDQAVANIAWVAGLLDRYEWQQDLGETTPFGMPTRRIVCREPAGVVGAITPWNYPLQINLAKLAPALAAGCTVVLKAAPDTPFAATVIGRLVAEETDIPPGVVNVIVGADHQLGAALAADRRVDVLSFTGSTATGSKIMAAAASNITKVFLELGGKSALVVLDDADMALAAIQAAFQITSHAGQGCAVTSRFVVPNARYDEAVSAVADAIASIPYGDPTDPAMLMGPLISETQRRKVLGYIDGAVGGGAGVALGGGVPARLPDGFFVEPTVLTGVDANATVAQEEVFGPVLVVLGHDGDDDAVAVANNSAYGLSGAVVGGSEDRARAVASRIRTGTISVNGGVWYSPDVPFGGYKRSGIGREMGVAGFEEYLETKALALPGGH
jgi:aldehyde dehydrogenase (NAD+)